MNKKFQFCLSLFVCLLSAEIYTPLPMMFETGSLFQSTYFGGASALPVNASGLSLNPAVVGYWHLLHKKKISVSSIYLNNEALNQKVGGAFSLAVGKGAYVGGEYLYRKEHSQDEAKLNRWSVAYGAMIVEETDADPLFFGASLSYIHHNGDMAQGGALPFHKIRQDTITGFYDTITDLYESGVTQREHQFNLVSMDVGFYQAKMSTGLSFSFVLENILGYTWEQHSSVKKNYRVEREVVDDAGNRIDRYSLDSTYYDTTAGTENTHDWLHKNYSSILFGTAMTLPLADEKLRLNVPLDFRFWGFMNKELRELTELKHRVEVHSGIELYVGRHLCGRFGWAWAPSNYKTNEAGQLDFGWFDNHLSGGFGINFEVATIDMMFSRDLWGIGIGVQF